MNVDVVLGKDKGKNVSHSLMILPRVTVINVRFNTYSFRLILFPSYNE